MLGLAEGLVPTPSTLVVLLAAISLGRLPIGLLPIAAFSVGFAAVPTVIALLLVGARRVLERPSLGGVGRLVPPALRRIAGVAPLGASIALVAAGLWLAAHAVTGGPL